MAQLAAGPFEETYADGPAVRGFLHYPAVSAEKALVLTHGAGGDCGSALLLNLADAFAEDGYLVLRCNLPFRQKRPSGPPFPAHAAEDRAGLKRAADVVRKMVPGRVFLGGHSYGGRQCTMLAADEPDLAEALLLLSYPLHPPRQPGHLRTGHFPKLKAPSLFVHGDRDPFGSIEEMERAVTLIPAPARLMPIVGAGHDLAGKGHRAQSFQGPADAILREFSKFTV